MKRSDFIYGLTDYLARHQAVAMTSGNYWQYLAERALDFAEQKGMLPPLYLRYLPDNEFQVFKNVNEWEPEPTKEGNGK